MAILIQLIWVTIKSIYLHKKYREKNSSEIRNSTKFTIPVYFSFYFIPICLTTLYSGFFSCERIIDENLKTVKKVEYYSDGVECLEFSFSRDFGLLMIITVLWRIYFAIRADYNRRIFNTEFNCRRNNKSGCLIFLIHIITVVVFNILNPFLDGFTSSLIIYGGTFWAFMVKATTDEFICLNTRNLEVVQDYFNTGFGIALNITLVALTIFTSLKYLNLGICEFINLKKGKFLDIYQLEKLIFASKHKNNHTNSQRSEISGLKNLCVQQAQKNYSFLEFPSFSNKNDEKFRQNSISSDFSGKSRKLPTVTITTSAGNTLTKMKMNNNPESHFILHEEYFFDFILRNYLKSMKSTLENWDDMKISVAYFLHDFMDLGKEAFTEVAHLDRKFDELTIENKIDVIRLNRILISNEAQRGKNQGKLDTEGMRIVKNLGNKIKISVDFYKDFWYTIENKNSETDKVSSSILKSFDAIHKVNKYWDKHNLRVFSGDVGSLLNYGNFVKRILNENEEGDLIIKKGLDLINSIIKETSDVKNFGLGGDVANLSDPVCLLERVDNELITKNCNSQFSFLLGFRKQDLVKKKASKYLTKHSINFYMSKFEMKDSNEDKAEKWRFGFKRMNNGEDDHEVLIFRNKNDFLRVFSSTIKIIRGEIGEKIILLKIDPMKYTKLQGHIVSTRTGRILLYDEKVSQIFDLPELHLKKNNIKYVNDLVPKFEKVHFHEFFSGKKISTLDKKTGQHLEFYVLVKRSSDYHQAFVFTIWKFQDMDVEGFKNKFIGFELGSSKIDDSKKTDIKEKNVESNIEFCFTFDEDLNYIGKFISKENYENMDMTPRADNIKSKIKESANLFSKILNPMMLFSKKKEVEEQKIDYGAGIKVRRLHNNLLLDLYEFDQESELEENEQDIVKKKMASLLNLQKEEDKIVGERIGEHKRSVLYNRANLEETIRTKVKAINVTLFQILSLLLLCFSCGYFAYEFYKIKVMTSDLTSYIKVDALHPFRNENIKLLHHRVVEVALANQGILPYWTFREKYTKEKFINESMTFIRQRADEMMEYQKKVLAAYSTISKQDQIDYLLNRKWTQIIVEEQPTNISFIDFFQTARAHIFSMDSYGIDNLTLENSEVNWVNTNFLQRVTKPTKDILNQVLVYKEEIRTEFVKLKKRFLFVMFARTVVAILFMMFLHQRISSEQDKTLSCYFSFSKEYINSMIDKCNYFLLVLETKDSQNKNNFNKGNNEDDNDNESSSALIKHNKKEFDNEKRSIFLRKRRRKMNRFNRKRTCNEILRSVFNVFNMFVVFIMGLNYYMSMRNLEFQDSVSLYMKNMADSLLTSGQMINRFQFYTLGLYGIMIQPNQTFFGQDKYVYFNATNVEVPGRMQTAFNNDEYFESVYLELFYKSRCGEDSLESDKEAEVNYFVKCHEIYNGILKKNFALAVMEQLNALNTIWDRFRWVMSNPETLNTFNEDCQIFPEFEIEKRNRFCILTSKTMFQIKLFHRQYLEPTIKKINLEGLASTLRSLDKANQDTEFSKYVYYIAQVVIFLLIIFIISKAKTEILKFNRMMLYHDVEDIRDNEEMEKYLIKLMG